MSSVSHAVILCDLTFDTRTRNCTIEGRRTINTRQAYEQKLQAQLDEWKAQIALLNAELNKAEANAQIEYKKTIEALEQQRDAAEAKLDELQRSGEDAWLDLKVGIEAAWERLDNAVKSAASRFK